MELQDKILNILQSMSTGADSPLKTVIYGSAFDANVRLDRNPSPAAIVYLLQSWTLDTSRMLKRKRCDIAIYFCARYDFNAKGEVIKQTMDAIEPVVDEFMSLLLSDSTIDVSDIRSQASYGKFDCNTCGYTLTFSAEEKQGVCF